MCVSCRVKRNSRKRHFNVCFLTQPSVHINRERFSTSSAQYFTLKTNTTGETNQKASENPYTPASSLGLWNNYLHNNEKCLQEETYIECTTHPPHLLFLVPPVSRWRRGLPHTFIVTSSTWPSTLGFSGSLWLIQQQPILYTQTIQTLWSHPCPLTWNSYWILNQY